MIQSDYFLIKFLHIALSHFAFVKLIHNLTITLLTHYSLWSVWSIGSNYRLSTLSTCPLIEFPRVSEVHPLLMSLIWMFGWDWEIILYVEYEFLFDNLKWFPCYFTLDSSPQKCINISLS